MFFTGLIKYHCKYFLDILGVLVNTGAVRGLVRPCSRQVRDKYHIHSEIDLFTESVWYMCGICVVLLSNMVGTNMGDSVFYCH